MWGEKFEETSFFNKQMGLTEVIKNNFLLKKAQKPFGVYNLRNIVYNRVLWLRAHYKEKDTR